MKIDVFKKMMEKEKPRRKRRHLESGDQQACVRWFRLAYPDYLCFSVPNGGSRNAMEAANLKKEGALSGVSDLIVVAHRAVLFIEMKHGKNKQSPSQIKFQKDVERLGHDYAVCYGKQDFQLTIERWLKERYGYESQV